MKETVVSREITALQEKNDALLVFDREKPHFNYPLHFHPEYELNYLYNAEHATRVVGDSIAEVGMHDLCLIGPNLYHVYQKGKCDHMKGIREVTTQFLPNTLPQELLSKDIFKSIADMLKRSEHGILFSQETAIRVEPIMTAMSHKSGFESFMEFLNLMYQLSISPDQQTLANSSFQNDNKATTDARMEKVHAYLMANYDKKVMLDDVANVLNMSPASVTRLIKHMTGKSFIEFLNEIRLGFATRLMIDSDMNISEICYQCGFNNISNFNRIFKKMQGFTPTEFRQTFHGKKRVL